MAIAFRARLMIAHTNWATHRRNRLRPSNVMRHMPTDFRDGRTFPRRGRERIGDAMWLLRLADKARAKAAGTIHDYIYPCPMDAGVMQRWGISPREWEEAVARHSDDAALYTWLNGRASSGGIEAANRWLREEKSGNLDRQDAEEVGTALAE